MGDLMLHFITSMRGANLSLVNKIQPEGLGLGQK